MDGRKNRFKRLGNSFLLPIFSGTMVAAAFPDAGLWELGWIGLAPLFVSIRGAKIGEVFRRTLLAVFVSFALDLAWLRRTMIDYGGLSVWLSILIMLLLAMYCSLYYAFAVRLAVQASRKLNLSYAITIPVFWVCMEYLRATLITGFPWNSLGQSQFASEVIVQNADWGSFYGISFILVLWNIVLAEWFCRGMAFLRTRTFFFSALIVGFAVGYGVFRLNMPLDLKETIKVGIVQGNIDQHEKWIGGRAKILDKHIALTKTILADHPEIVVWPEVALTFSYRFSDRYTTDLGDTLGARLDKFIRHSGITLVTGTLDYIQSKVFNSVCLIPPKGLAEYYHKTHLVPFGEYVPLSNVFFFVNRMVDGGIGTFDLGHSAQPLRFSRGNLGVTICYENIFPALVRKRVRAGADIICNVTNDAWFGRSAAAEQHFSASVFRAVESRCPVIRSANTGYSGAVSAKGRVIAKSSLFEAWAFTVKVQPGKEKSPYYYIGDSFAWITCFLSLFILIWSVLNPNQVTEEKL